LGVLHSIAPNYGGAVPDQITRDLFMYLAPPGVAGGTCFTFDCQEKLPRFFNDRLRFPPK